MNIRGADIDATIGVMGCLREAGYDVELLVAGDSRRVYRAVDPEIGECKQVHTVSGAGH